MLFNKQTNYWYRKYVPIVFQNVFKKLKPNFYDYFLLKRMSKKNIDFSGHGETAAVKRYLKDLNTNKKFYVDIGASDGVNSSSTLEFAKDDEWEGLSIEYDQEKFSKLKYIYKSFNNVHLLNKKVTPDNVELIFRNSNVPKDLTFINLDVDSYDLEIIDNILKSDFKPDIVSIEINEKIPPPIYFSVVYNHNHFWEGDHFYGCSLTAANEVFSSHNYILGEFKLNNAIFVNYQKFPNITKKNIEEAYSDGYKNVENRKELFKYNHDVEELLQMSPRQSIEFIDNLFKKYKGMYELRIVDN
mgnify:FL=1